MRLVISFNPKPKRDGSFPIPCIVEDENGFRILIAPDTNLSNTIIEKSIEYGCVAYWFENPKSFQTREDFLSGATPALCTEFPSVMAEVPIRTSSGFVHLHTHSEFSSLDGLSTVKEIVDRAVADNQPAIAITDHGNCAAHPYLQKLALDAGINPIMGIEAYFVDNRLRRPKGLSGIRKSDLDASQLEAYNLDNAEVRDYWHLILWAQNDVGLHNLWAISTEANRDGFYSHPRMDWDTLERFSEGVMCSTACLRGPVTQAILKEDEDLAVGRLSRLQDVFHDRLFVEIHTNTEPDQIKANPVLIDLAKRFSLPTIAVSDSHYSCIEHADAHKVWIAAQTGKNINDDSGLFQSDSPYHVMTVEEVRKSLSYLPESDVSAAIANTVLVADQCTARLTGNPKPPMSTLEEGGAPADVANLIDLCLANWDRRTEGKSHTQEEYLARFEMEMKMLIEKDFCKYFLMVSNYCLWSKRNGILVGPSRGSGGGSYVAYLCGITEIDPVDTGLLFERFMTKGRKELPDFDIDFPSSRIEEVYQYISDKYGSDSVVRVGTHGRLKNKGVIRKLASVFKGSIDIDWNDIDKISKIITKAESTSAGLGVSWDELWVSEAEALNPYRAKYPELFKYADIMVGRLNSYGKHAAGVVISPEEKLIDRLPLRVGDDGRFISDFDMVALAQLGHVKFDFLSLRTLDTLQLCIDLIKENTGEQIDIYSWKDEYLDQDVWSFISDGNTLGLFQIETPAGTRITKKVRPTNLQELADVVTLDRPGPMRSGLDEAYVRRKNGTEAITYVDDRLEGVLNQSYGVLLYQEDIMNICMKLAGYDSEEADKVRSILGKKKIELAKEEGRKFIPAVIERGMDPEAAQILWEQMEEFSRYAFNRSHAYAYAMIAYWCGFMKLRHPKEFYVASMSTVDQDRVGDFVIEARKNGFKILPPDINRSREQFSVEGEDILYGLEAIKGLGEPTAVALVANQPYTSYEDLAARKVPNGKGGEAILANLGIIKKLNAIGALESLYPNRKKLALEIEREESGVLKLCVDFNEHKVGAPNDLPCEFDWTSEPVKIGLRGQPLKGTPIPKKCTVRCRNYRPTESTPIETGPYTEKEIREIEMELLGVHLSSTPFDSINEAFPDLIKVASYANTQDTFEDICIAGIVRTVREKLDRNGKTFAIISLFAQDGNIDAIAFNQCWKEAKHMANPGELVVCRTSKNDRGIQIQELLNEGVVNSGN